MDYKEKYEQALERCKKEFNFNNLAYSHEEIKQRLEHVFPELKEDERIRKALIQHIKYKVSVISGWRKEELIAWLEKQGEQKPVEWSEEDENLFNLSLENLLELRNRFGEKYGKVGDCIPWLKSLKERMKGE